MRSGSFQPADSSWPSGSDRPHAFPGMGLGVQPGVLAALASCSLSGREHESGDQRSSGTRRD